ncbi:ferredoxin [Amycolatopsis thermoflava]|uniref:ferredoxin n=1 Tax=Amycolatopsis thermoflava TaxID=84480 RepID=UPI003EBE6874
MKLRKGPRLSVNNERCELFGTCQWEAPGLFELERNGRLRYRSRLTEEDWDPAVAAARSCPMQAIQIKGISDE